MSSGAATGSGGVGVTAGERAPSRYFADDVINDKYRVIEQLGAGATATVYRVLDLYTDDHYALKLFAPEVGIDAPRREYKAANGRPPHPNIAAVRDIVQTASLPPSFVIVQEYVDGLTLSDYCEPDGKRLDIEDSLDVIDQLLAALEWLHPDSVRLVHLELASDAGELTLDEFHELADLNNSGIVHRDVKPQNIRRRPDGVVKLIDFGIASAAGSTVSTRSATPEYVPPDADLFRWEPIYDLFAVGIIAFELLAGRSPFVEAVPSAGRECLLGEPRPDLPAPVIDFVERAIAEEPMDRFQTAHEMRDALAKARTTLGAFGESVLPTPADESAGVPESATVSDAANGAGLRKEYDRAMELAHRRGLGTRLYKHSLMLTPGGNRSRYLVNLAFVPGEGCYVAVSGANWKTYFGLSESGVDEQLKPPGKEAVSVDELAEFLDRLDQTVGRTSEVSNAKPVDTLPAIVDYLSRTPGARSIADVAAATGVPRGVVRRRLSDLSRNSCSLKYRDRVSAIGGGKYEATGASSADGE